MNCHCNCTGKLTMTIYSIKLAQTTKITEEEKVWRTLDEAGNMGLWAAWIFLGVLIEVAVDVIDIVVVGSFDV